MVEVKVEMKTEWWQWKTSDGNKVMIATTLPNENSMTKEKL